jgi:hypothetical protein
MLGLRRGPFILLFEVILPAKHSIPITEESSLFLTFAARPASVIMGNSWGTYIKTAQKRVFAKL